MEKKDFFIGILIGILVSFIGSFLFISVFTTMDFIDGFTQLKTQGSLGKLITLGALLNIGIVFLLFKKNKDIMAKGVVFAIFILTIYTLFI